ncbi:MAG TPA: 50S ribosomal protein L23 [Candidatus Bipolaricaulota bacterium]
MKLQAEDVLIAPLVSERSWAMQDEGKYTFRVHAQVNKLQIRQAVEQLFRVNVVKVWTQQYPGKPRQRKLGQAGRTRSWKKAIVQLQVGQRIEIYQ